jgi:hypothetical protein
MSSISSVSSRQNATGQSSFDMLNPTNRSNPWFEGWNSGYAVKSPRCHFPIAIVR